MVQCHEYVLMSYTCLEIPTHPKHQHLKGVGMCCSSHKVPKSFVELLGATLNGQARIVAVLKRGKWSWVRSSIRKIVPVNDVPILRRRLLLLRLVIHIRWRVLCICIQQEEEKEKRKRDTAPHVHGFFLPIFLPSSSCQAVILICYAPLNTMHSLCYLVLAVVVGWWNLLEPFPPTTQ